eukprot:PLAT2973.1.p1 GENE.PLAT2973.1~~PLAT2973.1.p1  ORF type:complete len:395 (+),score=198.32 PLAT2973.1:64-1248(+)
MAAPPPPPADDPPPPMPAEKSRRAVAIGERLTLQVYMLDNSFKTLLVTEETTAEDVCSTMASKLGIEEGSAYFALYLAKNGATLDRALQDEERPIEILEALDSRARLVYQIKLFMESIVLSRHAKVVHQQWIQAVHNVIVGHYPCVPADAIRLAALQVAVKFGEHNPAKHKEGFLLSRLVELIPAAIGTEMEPAAWEAEIFREHAALDEGIDPKSEYLDIVSSWPCYGCAFYFARQHHFKRFPTEIILGINSVGIHLLRPSNREMLSQFKLNEIYRWGFKPGSNFYFEVKKAGGAGPVYEFETDQGKNISDLLTEYAMALLREIGLSAAREDARAAEAEAGGAGAGVSEEYAAVKIQSMFRGYKARCEFDDMLSEMSAELDGAPVLPPPPPPGL